MNINPISGTSVLVRLLSPFVFRFVLSFAHSRAALFRLGVSSEGYAGKGFSTHK